jgi:hypothetical protein
MRRRDLSRLLLVAAAASTRSRAEGPAPAAPAPWNLLAKAGYVKVPDGSYELSHKLQTLLQNTIIGESRQNTVVRTTAPAEYVLEIGDGRVAPNAGLVQRLRFYGSAGNRACLHLSSSCHMWRLEELLFSGGPCPALLVENCWDSNYCDIDVLAHGGPGADPSRAAAVIFARGCNNIYCRGLRVEAAGSGGLYVDSGPIYVVMGKIDNGFRAPQSAPAVSVTRMGHLVLDDFYFGGMLHQYPIEVAGTLKLGRVLLDGGTGQRAAIHDRREWLHTNPQSFPGASAASMGPDLPILDLGAAQFRRYHPSVATETPAAVFSRIHPLRQARQLTTTTNEAASGDTRLISTTLKAARDDVYRNSFLVHNPSGTEAGTGPGARRRILRSFADGKMLLHGAQPLLLDTQWSVEYCAAHCTPIKARDVSLDRDQQLFAVLSRQLTLTSAPTYVASITDPAYGTTKMRIEDPAVERGTDLTGLFLIDNANGEPFYIDYGMDDQGCIGVLYDRRERLSSGRSFSVVAGYAAAVRQDGQSLRWTFAGEEHCVGLSELYSAGYDVEQFPLWGLGTSRALERLGVGSASVIIDPARSAHYEVTASDARPLAMSDPGNGVGVGARVGITLRNASAGALGDIVWGASYRLAPWTSPAPGHSRSIEFRFDGSHWIEIARTPADVPN